MLATRSLSPIRTQSAPTEASPSSTPHTVPDATQVTEDILAAALVVGSLGPAVGMTASIGSIITATASSLKDSLYKTTQLRLLRLHHLYDRHFLNYQPRSEAIKNVLLSTSSKEGVSSDSLLRLVSRDEWLDRCDPKSVLKSSIAEVLQILFDAKADPGTITSSCIHTIALHAVDMTFFSTNDTAPYSGSRTRAGDIQALSSFCTGLANSVNTGFGDKEKYILMAGSNMEGKITTFLKVSLKLDEALRAFQSATSIKSGLQRSQSDSIILATGNQQSDLLDFEPLKRSIVSSLANLVNVEVCRVMHLAITYPSTKNTFVSAVETWNQIITDSGKKFSINSLLGNQAAQPTTPFVESVRKISSLFGMVQKQLQSSESSASLTDTEWMNEFETFVGMGKTASSDSATLPFKIVLPDSESKIISLVASSGLLLLFAHSLLQHTETKPLNQLTVMRLHVEDLLKSLVEDAEELFEATKTFRVVSTEAALAEVAWYRFVCDYADVCLVRNEKRRIMQDFLLLDALCGGKGLATPQPDEVRRDFKDLLGKFKLQWFSSSSSSLDK
ncbi:hypothetical protein BCR33DRAFT_713571 [Rhizoclosmatium globosum]|uniref:Uncharacterized protein n=1 Tax=Rhizoclosmatium globosum TaxID=329046 RepID=A0A1Y2CSV4_9FUNG|nr:hypothetical protein BCR33DRAFT_713571 [Rhizoclosmatium globosum]|eukprot:ORY49976.1 hypothetical protein BCR33DRAFT_713571 [Rhizoclosmatium globosum]